MDKGRVHLLYLTPEPWPTFRPDVAALFGKYLPRLGITSDLLTDQDIAQSQNKNQWQGGSALLCHVPHNRAGQYLVKLWHQFSSLARLDSAHYDAVQVRDMPIVALWALMMARAKGLPFFYWMSFPQSEAQVLRARTRGPRAGIKYWFPLLQGSIGKWVLYNLVMPRADHVFVQTQRMLEDVAQHGITGNKMTPVPMGVDLETAQSERISASDDPRLAGRRVLIYLGTQNPVRNIDVLLDMVHIVRQRYPEVLLVLAGDTEDASHRHWLRQYADRLGIADVVEWLGWLPTDQAWRYVRAAEVGLSPIPRSMLLDCGSPTKAVEYMALGIPVVGNDNPDQAQVIAESGAGLCVAEEATAFADAVLQLLDDPARAQRMGAMGRAYVHQKRGYAQLAKNTACAYHRLIHSSTEADQFLRY